MCGSLTRLEGIVKLAAKCMRPSKHICLSKGADFDRDSQDSLVHYHFNAHGTVDWSGLTSAFLRLTSLFRPTRSFFRHRAINKLVAQQMLVSDTLSTPTCLAHQQNG